MDFENIFQQKLTIRKSTDVKNDKTFLIPNVYSYALLSPDVAAQQSLIRLLAGGNIFCENLFSYSFQPLDCYMFLYTYTGKGVLTVSGKTYSLSEHQLLFFHCNQPFQLHGELLPWSFKVFFANGERLSFFGELLHARKAPLFFIPEFSPIHTCMTQLLGLSTELSTAQFLIMQQQLNQILTTLYLDLQTEPAHKPARIPAYLIELKDQFDHHYELEFSLQSSQERYQVSKYRLCREFAAHFGEPPLRYLNMKRIENAKKMLLTSERSVQTISSMVGFDNVNHFINLFKKYVGTTPASFRQKASEDQSSLHSLSR